MIHSEILQAMREGKPAYVVRGKIQMDDAYLGGEQPGGMAGGDSENKVTIVAAIYLNEAIMPIHATISSVCGYPSEGIGSWAWQNLASASGMLTGGRACFRSRITVVYNNEHIVTGGTKSKERTVFTGPMWA